MSTWPEDHKRIAAGALNTLQEARTLSRDDALARLQPLRRKMQNDHPDDLIERANAWLAVCRLCAERWRETLSLDATARGLSDTAIGDLWGRFADSKVRRAPVVQCDPLWGHPRRIAPLATLAARLVMMRCRS